MSEPQSWSQLDARPCPEWFLRDRFGIFVHWGVYSVPAWRSLSPERFGSYAEWYYASVYGRYRNWDGEFHRAHYGDTTYRDFAPALTAELFDPARWADLFARAGARYVVLTSKHHDGYCLWPTDNPHKVGWNSGDVGPRRDLVGELADAVRAAGMRMGLYYSIIEWETHTSRRMNGEHFIPEADARRFGIDPEAYPDQILHPQWRELNERYRPSLIFTDGGEWDCSEEYTRTRELLTWLYTEAPNRVEVVVNDRIHVGMPGVHGDYYSTEYQDADGFGSAHPWEESRAIGGSYGYNRAENIEDYATAGQLTALIAQTVAKGGHFLLDVGPTADGRIPVIQQERLLQIGAWMDVAGPGIHASAVAAGWSVPEGVHPTLTRPTPADSRLTGSTLYLFVEAQAGAGERGLRLQAPAGVGVTGAVDLTSGEPLQIRTERGAAAAGAANTGDEGGAILFLQTPAPRADGCPAVVRVDLTCAQTS